MTLNERKIIHKNIKNKSVQPNVTPPSLEQLSLQPTVPPPRPLIPINTININIPNVQVAPQIIVHVRSDKPNKRRTDTRGNRIFVSKKKKQRRNRS